MVTGELGGQGWRGHSPPLGFLVWPPTGCANPDQGRSLYIGHHQQVSKFSATQVDSKWVFRGLTPLHSASKRGQASAILLLAAAGADKAAQDEDGLSAVHHATLANRLAALVTLIQLGAPTNLRSKAGRTPLAQARHDDHEELVN